MCGEIVTICLEMKILFDYKDDTRIEKGAILSSSSSDKEIHFGAQKSRPSPAQHRRIHWRGARSEGQCRREPRTTFRPSAVYRPVRVRFCISAFGSPANSAARQHTTQACGIDRVANQSYVSLCTVVHLRYFCEMIRLVKWVLKVREI